MIPNGIDSVAWMQQLAGRLDTMHERNELESALDDIEYLVDALDPELQPAAYQLIETINRKLGRAVP